MKKYLIFALIIFAGLIVISVQETSARTATDSQSVNWLFQDDCRWMGTVTAQVTKTFDFRLPNGQLAGSDITLTLATSSRQITATNQSLIGSYEHTGGAWDTPPMDDQVYNISDNLKLKMNKPSGGYLSITSSNPNVISCTNTTCTAQNLGTARITINPTTAISHISMAAWWGRMGCVNCDGADCEYCAGGWMCAGSAGSDGLSCGEGTTMYTDCAAKSGGSNGLYNFNIPIVYTVIVVPDTPNQPPIANCGSITNTTNDSATLNWSFTDQDRGDTQASAQVQVATDSSFNNLVYNQVILGQASSVTINGLNTTTVYYWRLRLTDDKNNTSAWSDCGNFQLGQPYCYVTPRSASVKVDSTQQYKAYYDPDGSGPAPAQEVTNTATWSAQNTGIATVNGTGLATGKGVGFTQIQAACQQGLTGRALIIVYSTPVAGQAVCGNGIIEEGEQCDGTNLGGNSCASLGYVKGGVLRCYPPGNAQECIYDVSGCIYSLEETLPR